MINMMSLGKKGHKKLNYLSANWYYLQTLGDGSIELKSPDRNIENVIVPADKVRLVHLGWK